MMSLRKQSVVDGLCLAAAPVFAVMALLAAVLPPPDVMCMSHQGLSIGGMVPMYVLMSVFHTRSWLRVFSPATSPSSAPLVLDTPSLLENIPISKR